MPTQSDPRSQTSTVRVKVNGQPLSPDVASKVYEVTIEQDMVLPDTFSIRIHDIASPGDALSQTLFPLADSDHFPIGKDVEIAMGREELAGSALKGEITSIELEMRADGLPVLTVRGYDKAHRLNRERLPALGDAPPKYDNKIAHVWLAQIDCCVTYTPDWATVKLFPDAAQQVF